MRQTPTRSQAFRKLSVAPSGESPGFRCLEIQQEESSDSVFQWKHPQTLSYTFESGLWAPNIPLSWILGLKLVNNAILATISLSKAIFTTLVKSLATLQMIEIFWPKLSQWQDIILILLRQTTIDSLRLSFLYHRGFKPTTFCFVYLVAVRQIFCRRRPPAWTSRRETRSGCWTRWSALETSGPQWTDILEMKQKICNRNSLTLGPNRGR